MYKRRLIMHLTLIILVIFAVNYFANKFFWYFSFWYFDMIMHFLGGLFAGLACIYIFPPKDSSVTSILKILILVLIIGVGWEVFEILVNDTIVQNPFNVLDTVSDIFFDLSGGSLALLYFLKRIMPGSEITL